jgi:hypothetical protein
MEIQPATEGDIAAIVNLLKISLGETLTPKSERYWRWKHIENPFGTSPVLLCREGNDLIGVRAFMRWQWIKDGQLFRAVRAVDTATHPQHQGKGIFKKLTLSLVSQCTKEGDHFVFNTPNNQSKPGYLKMGWQEVGRLPIGINIQKPISIIKNFLTPSSATSNVSDEHNQLKYFLEHPSLPGLLSQIAPFQYIRTNMSVSFLRWRYLHVPVASYLAIGEEQGGELTGLIIGRIKQTRFGRELRLTDIFVKNQKPGKLLVHRLRESLNSFQIDYCTFSGAIIDQGKQLLGRVSFTASVGPIVTIRRLSMEDLGSFDKFKDWSPSLGDLELF